jgi:hypothetical protein
MWYHLDLAKDAKASLGDRNKFKALLKTAAAPAPSPSLGPACIKYV